jgi:hypothetical protein
MRRPPARVGHERQPGGRLRGVVDRAEAPQDGHRGEAEGIVRRGGAGCALGAAPTAADCAVKVTLRNNM